jgi:hypothetical protein
MSVYDRVRSILSYGETLAIDFRCQALPVNRALFAKVAASLNNLRAQSPVAVYGDSRYVAPGQAPADFIPLGRTSGVIAEYDLARNAFRLPNENLLTIFEEATVVHEAVHCGFDLDRRIGWPWWGQEANAYIAGARFSLNKGVTVESMRRWSLVHGIAAEVADQLTTPGQEVTWPQFYPLQQALLSCEIYRGYSPTYSYPNNG